MLPRVLGKGTMQTYWCRPPGIVGSTAKASVAQSISSGMSSEDDNDDAGAPEIELAIADLEGTQQEKEQWREECQSSVVWLSELFKTKLKRILSQPGKVISDVSVNSQSDRVPTDIVWDEDLSQWFLRPAKMVSDEYAQLPAEIEQQIIELVARLAFSFESLPYHNFAHGCFVVLSLQNMVVTIEEKLLEKDLKLTPLSKFAFFFSALARNIRPPLHDQTWTENQSMEIALGILMDDKFDALQRHLFSTKAECALFHRLVNNLVVATFSRTDDVLAAGCDQRWEDAFGANKQTNTLRQQIAPMLEHLMLIAQQSHWVHNWENYAKWIMKLLEERQKQYHDGHLDADPTSSWYHTAMLYSDSFLIPLTKKIDEAGFLGVMGSEFVVHSEENRQHWESAGLEIVANASKQASGAETVESAPKGAPTRQVVKEAKIED